MHVQDEKKITINIIGRSCNRGRRDEGLEIWTATNSNNSSRYRLQFSPP